MYRELNFPLAWISSLLSLNFVFSSHDSSHESSLLLYFLENCSVFLYQKVLEALHDITSILRSNSYFPIINKDLCCKQLLTRDDCKSLMHCKTHYHQWSTDHQRSTGVWASSSIFHKQSTDFETF